MTNAFRAILLSLLLMTGLGTPATASPFEDAETAYNKGDYETTLRLVRPLAERGDARAQNQLGVMRSHGHGVPQNKVRAYMWFKLAAAQGSNAALKNLTTLFMTLAQLAEAEKLVCEWKPSEQMAEQKELSTAVIRRTGELSCVLAQHLGNCSDSGCQAKAVK